MKHPSQLYRIQFNPRDPTWTFPFATRQRIEKLRHYFLVHLPSEDRSQKWRFRGKYDVRVLPQAKAKKMRARGIVFPSVPPQWRKATNDYFNRKVNEWIAEHGSITWGKKQSIRMHAACVGRHGFNGEWRYRNLNYVDDKRTWDLYCEWEKSQEMQALPKTPSKVLEVL